MNNNFYKSGTYNFICDICAQKYKRDQGRLNWQRLLVCFNCYEPKHSVLEPLPTVQDSISVADARPRNTTAPNITAGGLSIWDQIYMGSYGLDPNITWDNWTETWDGHPDPDNIYIP